MEIDTDRVPRYSKLKLSDKERQERLTTASDRALPDFIVIGAQKSGTTSLFNYLGLHPQIVPSVVKQVRYFDGGLDPSTDNFELGLDWYKSFFPLKEQLKENNAITGEASPMYLFYPMAADRIASILPEVKLIVVLRSPVERAISHYFHSIRAKAENVPILDALKLEEVRLKESIEACDYRSFPFTRHSYKSRGLYAEQLQRYLRVFERENMLVLEFDSLFSDVHNQLSRVFNFLGVDDQFKIDDVKPKGVGNNKTAVDIEVRQYLNDFFHEPNRKIYDLFPYFEGLWGH